MAEIGEEESRGDSICGGEQRHCHSSSPGVESLLACLRVMRYSEKVVTWNAENVTQAFSAKRAENQALG